MTKRRANPKTPKAPAGPTPRQRLIFRFVALVLIARLTHSLCSEAALRLAGYGYDTAYFKPLRIGNTDYLVNNDDFVRRFFPPQLTRLPEVLRMEKEKPPGVTRIFILGESAALGDPAPAYAAARYMQAMLGERFPNHRFEVVNVAITAINSHAILPIARACAEQHGDFWIVYMGNNEMVGPFGAASVFGAQAPPRWMVRASLALQELRAGQLLTSLTRHLKMKNSSAASWGGMEMFLGNQIRTDDARKETVYRNFREKTFTISSALAWDSGARVLLNTVAVNLKDCPPFASAPTRSPHSADAEYRNAQTLLSGGNIAQAREEFQKACDDDTLPFRADSRVNTIIRDAATELASPNLLFCDAAAPTTLGEPSAEISGDELFYEHVHFNFDGNYRLGRAWAEKIEPSLPSEMRANAAKDWASQETCERRLGISDWNRAIVLSEVIRRRQKLPLSSESNNAQESQQVRNELSAVNHRMNASDAAAARAMYLDDMQRDPDDYLLRFGYGDFLEGIGDVREASAQWRQLQDLLPQYYLVYLQQGRMLEREGQLDDAHAAFQRAVQLYPRMTVAWFEMSNIDASQGKYSDALDECERASQLEPTHPVFYACEAQLLSKMNRHPDAIEKYRQSIKVQPTYLDGYFGLAGELTTSGQFAEATNELNKAVQVKPDSTRAHLELGQALLKMNNRDAARQQFQETLRLDPNNTTARQYLTQ